MAPTRGFSLIELSVVLFIAAILLAAGLRVLNTQIDNSAYSLTKTRQEAIKDALTSYLGKNNRLPCPDTASPPDGTEKRTVATPAVCVLFFGVLPYATLGLTKEMALDGWENYVGYGVSPKWTLTYNAAAPANTPQTTVATNAFNVGYTGALTVNDRVPASNAIPTQLTNAAVVVLISYGKNGLGAITFKGSQNVLPAPVTFDEYVNVNVGGAGTTYFRREYTDNADPTYGGFDDVVRVLQAPELLAPLTKEGSLTSTNALMNQTLSAINDAIIGFAIASHTGAGIPYSLPTLLQYPALGISILDPWGNPIIYNPITPTITATTLPAIAYQLTSYGPNGAAGGGDDIVSTTQVTQVQGVIAKNGLGY